MTDTETKEDKDKCHKCKEPSAMVCKCGDYWCGDCYAHCAATDCKNWGNLTDGLKHPYCRAHKDLAEYPNIFTAKVIKTPADHKENDVRFFYEGKPTPGFGYQAKEGGKIGLVKCPNCERENYALNVASGQCTWCEFNISMAQIEEVA